MNFNFTTVENAKTHYFGSSLFPEKTVRFTKTGLILGEDVVSRLKTAENSHKTASGETVYLGVAYDNYNQAIRIFIPTTSDTGFSFYMQANNGARLNVPKNLRTTGMPTGDYKAVDGQPGIFQLAR